MRKRVMYLCYSSFVMNNEGTRFLFPRGSYKTRDFFPPSSSIVKSEESNVRM